MHTNGISRVCGLWTFRHPVQNAACTTPTGSAHSGMSAATDDTVFQNAYLACCMVWLAGACWVIPQVYEADQRWGVSTWRQRL